MVDALIIQVGILGKSLGFRRGTCGGYLHVSLFPDVQVFVLWLARVGLGGGRHRRSIFLVSEKRQLFRWSTGTVSCVNNILGNTAKIGR